MILKNRKIYIICFYLLLFLIAFLIVFLSFKHEKSESYELTGYYQPAVFHLPPDVVQTEQGITSPISKTISSTTRKEKTKSSVKIHLPILMFHYVEPLTGKEDRLRVGLTTTNIVFEEQLKTLQKEKFQTIFARDVKEYFSGQKALLNKSVVLTFDDGYEDFYTYVFPLLKKYQAKATVYVIYDAINTKNYLTDEQISEMLNSGLVEVGSHTLDHKNLKDINSIEANRQIVLSKELFEKRFKIRVSTFAYPFGGFNKEVLTLTKEAKYDSALSVIPGTYQSIDNIYYLFRLRPGSRTGQQLIKILEN